MPKLNHPANADKNAHFRKIFESITGEKMIMIMTTVKCRQKKFVHFQATINNI